MQFVKIYSEDDIENNIFLPKAIDLFEIGAENITDVLHKLQNYYHVSKETLFIKHDGELIGIYGIRDVNDFTGIPWLLTVDIPKKYVNSFLRFTSNKMKELQKEYKILFNYTSEKNVISHRWLEFLGFVIDRNNPLIISDNKVLYKFEWRRE